jgi:hypothetical protein
MGNLLCRHLVATEKKISGNVGYRRKAETKQHQGVGYRWLSPVMVGKQENSSS